MTQFCSGLGYGVRRRQVLRSCAGILGLSAGRDALALSPYEEAARIEFGPSFNGGVRRCPGNVNPNCISTSSITQAYAPAFQAPEGNPSRVAQVVVDAVKAADPESYLVDSQRLADGCEYRRMSVKGIWTEDVLEFIVAPQPKQPDSALVLYRSMAGTVKYIWPLQQPLSDLDTQKKRMKRVREELGYRLVGCELIECYDF
eukprot:CAMPEP_0177763070 /NCGR_PEP_ID=MMETSP0491_2-20121128/6675_1 /TAXON_ID=63592 /ORGANISM="Tetraselmis chuii, Strain PLY429" /LENGTH=200 /DNA_ID=CAMNT_0019279153 /DNA_START=195 /DNA_END=797 /DNA_ORIENTATION=-